MAKSTAPQPASRPGTQTGTGPAAKVRTRSSRWSFLQSLLFALALALGFRQLIVQAFRIPSSSMEKTLLVGDFLFVNKFLYGSPLPFTDARLPRLRAPRRGDIIVFKSPQDGRDFIKRCVAVGGDTLEVRAKTLYVNGRPQEEPYAVRNWDDIRPPNLDRRDFFGPVVVPPQHLFMMGDNRDNSHDSRYWGFLPEKNLQGKAMFIYFSIDYQRGFPPRLRLGRMGRLIR